MEEDGQTLSGRRMWTAGIILALSNFMVILDTSIANVSVPHIAGSLAIAPDQGTWVVTSYSVAEAICVPLTGWLAQRFGTLKCYTYCMIGFALFSALCGMSVTLGMLVTCRVGQGLCGGPIMPLTQTVLVRVFPPRQRGTAMGLWAMTTVAAPIAGPLLGGTISDDWSWHWIFFINLPIAALCLFGVLTLLSRFETPTVRTRIDAVGLGLLVIWVGALQIMLDIGREHDWFQSTEIVVLAVVAAIGFAFFLVWELTEEQPVVDLRVFRHRGFTVAVFALALIYGSFFSAIVVTPQWLQGFLGYTAAQSGYVIAWQGVFALVMSPIVGRMIGRVDPRVMVTAGVLWLAFATFLRTHWTSGADYWTFALPHLLLGFGTPLFFVPITLIAMGSVEPRETASAAGLQNFMRTLSAAIGTSIATTAWVDQQQTMRADLANVVQLPSSVRDGLAAQGIGMEQARGLLSRLVDQEAVALATTHLFQMSSLVLACSAALIWFAPRPKRAASAEGAH